jgi:hypothetical protein
MRKRRERKVEKRIEERREQKRRVHNMKYVTYLENGNHKRTTMYHTTNGDRKSST